MGFALSTYRGALLLILSLGLAGCGFKLRHSAPASTELSQLYISTLSTQQEPFKAALATTLQAQGMTLVKHPSQAKVIIKLLESQQNQTLINSHSSTQVRNYLISYRLKYQLLNQQAQSILAPQTIMIRRYYTLHQSQLLSESAYLDNVQQNLYQDAVHQLLARLNTLQLSHHVNAHYATELR